jgi:endogenous inhibitor of DNA gyrase (YacG/DUF329 family)
MTEKCLECGKPANWIRHTQFAGDHPYCDEHARMEKDFDDMDDSYAYWSKVADLMSDKGYEESTHEKQAEFAKNRKDPWDEWKPSKEF